MRPENIYLVRMTLSVFISYDTTHNIRILPYSIDFGTCNASESSFPIILLARTHIARTNQLHLADFPNSISASKDRGTILIISRITTF